MPATNSAPQAPAGAGASKPILIDTEKGRRSVLSFINSGAIELAKAPTFKAAEDVIWKLQGTGMFNNVHPSAIILDSSSALAATTIQDVVMENPKGLWENRAKLQASQPTWGMMGGLITRLMRVSRSLNIPLIITAAEQEREDKVSGLITHFPALNPQVLTDLVYNSDTVLRVYRTAGKRVVRCQPDDHYFAKIRVPDNLPPAPDYFANEDPASWAPTIKKLNQITGGLFVPLDDTGELSPVMLYGMPCVGKTRLAVELALSVK